MGPESNEKGSKCVKEEKSAVRGVARRGLKHGDLIPAAKLVAKNPICHLGRFSKSSRITLKSEKCGNGQYA